MAFMFPDTLRAESFSSYGFPLQTTPNLDAFAKTGVRFEQTHVQHTQCSPSRLAMLTGRYMHVLGHRTQSHLVQPYEFNYFRTLKEHGVHVQYYGNDAFSPDAFNRSVSWWSDDIGLAKGPNAYAYGEAGYWSMLHNGSTASKWDLANGDYRAVHKASAWMADDPPQPFLLFLPGIGAHPPYAAPHEFHEKWSDLDELKAKAPLRPRYGAGKPKYHSQDRGIPHYRNLTYLPDETMYKIQSVYLGMVSYSVCRETGLQHVPTRPRPPPPPNRPQSFLIARPPAPRCR